MLLSSTLKLLANQPQYCNLIKGRQKILLVKAANSAGTLNAIMA
jgi:hypothetical protein